MQNVFFFPTVSLDLCQREHLEVFIYLPAFIIGSLESKNSTFLTEKISVIIIHISGFKEVSCLLCHITWHNSPLIKDKFAS